MTTIEAIANLNHIYGMVAPDIQRSLDVAIKALEERPQGEWIPIKMRSGTDEEYEEFSQYGDCPREDFRVFECQLPNDEQEVLVTTRWGNICVDIWHRDVDCCYFEDNSDDDDVIAWMPFPEPYKKGGDAGMAVCPFCGASPHKDYKNFCPNCGARMGGSEK